MKEKRFVYDAIVYDAIVLVAVLVVANMLMLASARAGSIAITVTNDAGAVVGTKTYAITTAHILRIANVMKSRYGQVPSGPPDPVTGIIPMRDRTNTEALLAWIGGFMQGTIDAVAGDEKATAAEGATKAVAPIVAQ